jgi:hypothetical protein
MMLLAAMHNQHSSLDLPVPSLPLLTAMLIELCIKLFHNNLLLPETALEKALQQSLAAADASEAAAEPCEAPIVEISLRPASNSKAEEKAASNMLKQQHAEGQGKLGKPPVMVSRFTVKKQAVCLVVDTCCLCVL